MWAGKSRLEYCFDSALRSPSPLPVPPRAGSNVGLAAVVITYSTAKCTAKHLFIIHHHCYTNSDRRIHLMFRDLIWAICSLILILINKVHLTVTSSLSITSTLIAKFDSGQHLAQKFPRIKWSRVWPKTRPGPLALYAVRPDLKPGPAAHTVLRNRKATSHTT